MFYGEDKKVLSHKSDLGKIEDKSRGQQRNNLNLMRFCLCGGYFKAAVILVDLTLLVTPL